MELTQLYYFRTVAKTQNITAAAEILHISQPSLSKVIKRLEDDLGAQLFDRKASKVTLNPFGEAFLVYVDMALDALGRGRQCLEQMQTGSGSGIRIASTFSGVPNMLVEQFSLQHPELSITEVNTEPEEIASLLMNDHVDFALTLSPLDQAELEELGRVIEPLLLHIPAASPKPAVPVRLADYEKENFAVFEGGKDSYATILRCCNAAGFVPIVSYRSSRSQRVHELVNQLNLCTLMPAHMVLSGWDRLPEGTRSQIYLVDEPHCNRILHLYRRRRDNSTPETQLFADFASGFFVHINNEITRMLMKYFPEKTDIFHS